MLLLAANILIANNLAAFPQAQVEEFSAAAIKLAAPGGRTDFATGPASLTIRGARMRSLIAWAYEVETPQVSGPDSLDSDRYDVFATAASPVNEADMRRLLAKLLASRFGLVLHRESKEVQAYVLQVAKSGGKLKPSADDAAGGASPSGKRATLRGTTMTQLAAHLADEFHSPVVDLTGLKGLYDLSIDISPYLAGGAKEEDIPAIVAQALEEQVGLRLDARQSAVEILFVDHIRKAPVEN